jgi:hypothetical protein
MRGLLIDGPGVIGCPEYALLSVEYHRLAPARSFDGCGSPVA